jgi:plasmid replication initiation protein
LLDDEDFIEIRRKHAASAEASVKEFGEKTLKTIQMAFGKITNTGECEEKAYQVLKELKGLEGTSIPGVADADAVYEAVFDKIANEYTSNKVLVGHIERGFRVLPREAEVLPTIFSNFPNILNDVKLKEEEQPRPRSPWNF